METIIMSRVTQMLEDMQKRSHQNCKEHIKPRTTRKDPVDAVKRIVILKRPIN